MTVTELALKAEGNGFSTPHEAYRAVVWAFYIGGKLPGPEPTLFLPLYTKILEVWEQLMIGGSSSPGSGPGLVIVYNGVCDLQNSVVEELEAQDKWVEAGELWAITTTRWEILRGRYSDLAIQDGEYTTWLRKKAHRLVDKIVAKGVPASMETNMLKRVSPERDVPLSIVDAVRAGNLVKVAEELQKGLDFDERDAVSRWAIHYAAYDGRRDILVLLFLYGACTGVKLGASMLWAALSGREKGVGEICSQIVKLLLHLGADLYTQESTTVAGIPKVDLIKLLVEQMAPLDAASIVKEGTDSRETIWQLLLAVERENEATIRLLIEYWDVVADSKFKDRYGNGQTPLSRAAENGDCDIVQLLVELEREDVDADSKDKRGRTPLSWAAEKGHNAIARLLVEREDVDADSKDTYGRTPLSWAAEKGHEAIVRLLVEREDVDADSTDTDDQTPLSWAAREGHEAIVRLFVERGDMDADPKDS